jgi:hypothetical protein
MKTESRVLTEKTVSFYSELNADSKYAVLFEKYRAKKNDLMNTYHFLFLSNVLLSSLAKNIYVHV